MKTPADWRRRGLGNLRAACLSDPRRRVRNDAYYDDASNYQRAGEKCLSGELMLAHGQGMELIGTGCKYHLLRRERQAKK